MRLLVFLLVVFNVIKLFSQDSLATAVATRGDGVYSLLRKNNIDPAKFYAAFIEANKNLIGEEEVLKAGQTYYLPDTITLSKAIDGNLKSSRNYPIFGPDFSTVAVLGNRLAGTVYYLISGHGGPDPGAIEDYKGAIIAEDEYAYDITLRLARELIAQGAEVFLIIQDEDDGIRNERVLPLDTDEVTYPDLKIPLNQLERLQQRVGAVNKLYKENRSKYQRLLVTHIDSRSKGTNIDVFFYHHEKSANGKRLAESIHQTFLKKYNRYQPNRGYKGTFADRSNLYLVKNTLPAMAYIEIGNIRNKKDQKRILDPDNRQALAKWISEGVLLDYELENSKMRN